MKKLLCSLLAVVMLIAFCGCGLNANIKEFKVSGDEMTQEELAQWFEEIATLEQEKAESGELVKSQWYSVSVKMAMEMSEGEEYENMYTTVSGKVYVTPFAYETKAKLTGKAKMESAYLDENEKLEKASGSEKMNMVMVNGESYTKTASVEKDETGKREEVDYYMSEVSSGDEIIEDLLGELGDFDIEDIFGSLDDNAKIYKKGNGIAIQYEASEAEGDDSRKTLVQLIIEYKKDSAELKQMCYYVLNEASITYDGVTTKQKMVTKFEIKTATFGASVKRPGDYYKYDRAM